MTTQTKINTITFESSANVLTLATEAIFRKKFEK